MTSKNKNHRNKLSRQIKQQIVYSWRNDIGWYLWSLIWNWSPQSQYKNIKRSYKREIKWCRSDSKEI